MRVCYVIDSLVPSGGAEQSLASMAPGLVRGGVDLHVVSLSDAPGLQARITESGATVSTIPGRTVPASAAALSRQIRALRPDLLHTTLARANAVGRAASVITGTPLVTSLVNVSYGPEYLEDPGLRAWKVRVLHTSDALSSRRVRRYHALTQHVADVMAARLRYPRSRIDIIPRGRDPQQLGCASEERRRRLRAELGTGQGPVLLTAARHERQKGLDVAIRAFASVRASMPDARLVMAGREGNQTAALTRLVHELGLADAVMFLGTRTDVPDLLCACDVFVMPSRWEGLGSVLLEAMALGAPIVASDIPPIRETVAEQAILVAADDDRALAEGILQTLGNRDAATERTRAATMRFNHHYTLERVSRDMVGFYQRALA
ncbi:MAG TPA: glycosyltransferase family 4 protein [Actinomycetales bacterium]|nr:glycosyltransferase family 4 protein [Actinomycetales bacterium]